MYLISGQAHLRLQPAVALVAAHAKLRLYAVQGVVGKDAFMPQISVGKGAERLLRAAGTMRNVTSTPLLVIRPAFILRDVLPVSALVSALMIWLRDRKSVV